ncbi:membrane protein insertion efficiency factor YidD [Patescibacteria group bacterium]|nr:membrane protein insertion efficiency factor YidD [Patescibacteria group bacterium]MBU0879555.1 membrane protein insertion efficiency factor YidD [Patescibacteria group bacterium]MBU0880394.1 membrane protein insertion efficiency factor YidD [Patescibacteria group bacterium]MBU0898056.1 membrane protein insertion efficiency factor YidD [Patescibacteria group bacterium]MBU1063013.1 membrane protein insertion efficiency factor YidD [Patescibacteria group bacterium]
MRYSRFFVIKLLKLYQRTLSFDHGVFKFLFPQGYCRFRPTCSDYAIAAIEKYGVIKGGIKAIWRVLRCNPFNPGGWDPLK